MIPFLILAAVWVVCGVLAYGLILGYFRREYPTASRARTHWVIAFWPSLSGPVALIAAVIFLLGTEARFRHGFMWRVPR